MFKINFHKKHVALLFTGMLLLSVMACGQKEKVISSHRIDLSENSYLTVENRSSKRTTECFVDGKMTEYSVYYFATGEIVCHDLAEETEVEEKRYYINDFFVTDEDVLNSYTAKMDESSYILTKETEFVRIAELYKDDKLIQQALYYFETGEMLCRIWSEGNKGEAIVCYHINDFLVTEEKEE